MAWIESHQALERHPKVLFLKELQGWSLDETIGKLHRFWWWCLDFAPDGNLEKYGHVVLADSVGVPSEMASTFVTNMVKARWLDSDPYFRVHDWWDYAGRFLQVKYKGKPDLWKKIRDLYQGVQTTTLTTVVATDHQPTNLNQPTNIEDSREAKRMTLDELRVTPDLEEWARKEGIPQPGAYLDEFKDYWRGEGKTKKDWVATFRNRLRYLRDHGRLKVPAGAQSQATVIPPKPPANDPIARGLWHQQFGKLAERIGGNL